MQSNKVRSGASLASRSLGDRITKGWLNREALPWEAMKRLRQSMMMARHRRLAIIGDQSTILADGWIENPEGTQSRIIVGKRCVIRGHLFVPPSGGHIVIGDDTFIGQDSYIWSGSEGGLHIGKNVLISHQVNIHDFDSHAMNPELRAQHFASIRQFGHPQHLPGVASASVVIEDYAWIGFGASVLKGVTVGRGAVVAAQAVVTKNIPPWTVVAGFPAQHVKDISHLAIGVHESATPNGVSQASRSV